MTYKFEQNICVFIHKSLPFRKKFKFLKSVQKYFDNR